MKFKSLRSVELFLSEVSPELVETANEDFEPTDEMMELFIKKRKRLVPKMKDFQKSQASKSMWRKNRYKILKGIKSFHKSTAGKSMHRRIGRFLALRDTSKRETKIESIKNPTHFSDLMKSLSSYETHNYIELGYYRPLSEEAEYQAFSDILQMRLYNIKNSIKNDGTIKEKNLDFMISLIPEKILIDQLQKNHSKSFDELFEQYKSELSKLEDNEDFIYLTAYNKVKYGQ